MKKNHRLLALGVVVNKKRSIDTTYEELKRPDIKGEEQIARVIELVGRYCEKNYQDMHKTDLRRIKEYVAVAFAYPAALMGEKTTRGVRTAIAKSIGEIQSTNIVSIDIKLMRGFYSTYKDVRRQIDEIISYVEDVLDEGVSEDA